MLDPKNRFITVELDMVEAIVDLLQAPEGCLPTVAITTPEHGASPWIDPGRLVWDLPECTAVLWLNTPEVAHALSAALPSGLGVGGGDARLWRYSLALGADPRCHPRFRIRSALEAGPAYRLIVQRAHDNEPLFLRELALRDARKDGRE